ncbi:MAG TPA: homoserine kinase [Anaerolineae bacterium]|nr:homoserine kinase [Anaerolineae bacterium]
MNMKIKVPATTANLGPGFDTIGLALDLWNETDIKPSNDFSIHVTGEGAGRLARGRNNLIVRAAQKLADHIGMTLPAFHADCVNQIPLSSGLGSSAAAIMTGLLAGNTLLKSPLSNGEILNLAANMEGHADNVSAALMGGLVVSMMDDGKVIARQIPTEVDFHVTVALPDFHISTKDARASLPRKVSMKNAVYNISRTVLVTEAFRRGDLSLLGEAMRDKLHQPYRLKLIPGAQAAMDAAKDAGAGAVALSGAGPSVIAFSSKAEAGIDESMKRAFQKAGLAIRIFKLGISGQGAEIQRL